ADAVGNTPLASFRCFAKCSGDVSNARLRSCIILFKNFENNGSEFIRTGGLVERLPCGGQVW
ncbi:hypothetical protein VZ94_07415, partial [Methylocucumis oryzae]